MNIIRIQQQLHTPNILTTTTCKVQTQALLLPRRERVRHTILQYYFSTSFSTQTNSLFHFQLKRKVNETKKKIVENKKKKEEKDDNLKHHKRDETE